MAVCLQGARREALFVSKHRTYSHDLKVEAAKAVIEGRMTKPEAMESYGLKSKTQIDTWFGSSRRRPRRPSPQAQGQTEEGGARLPPRRGARSAGARAGTGARNPKTNQRLSGRDRAEAADSLRLIIRSCSCSTSSGFPRAPTTITQEGRIPRPTDGPMCARFCARRSPASQRNGIPPGRHGLRAEQGLSISGKTALKLMREEGLRCRRRRRRYDSYRGEQGKIEERPTATSRQGLRWKSSSPTSPSSRWREARRTVARHDSTHERGVAGSRSADMAQAMETLDGLEPLFKAPPSAFDKDGSTSSQLSEAS